MKGIEKDSEREKIESERQRDIYIERERETATNDK